MFEKTNLEIVRGGTEKKDLPICDFCFKKHEPSVCMCLNKFKNEILKTGMISPENGKTKDRTQEILGKLSGDDKKFRELITALASYYGMGEYKKEKDSNGNVTEKFRGENITVSSLGEKDKKIKINSTPIKFDDNLKEYVWRYNTIKESGEIDPVVKINSFNTLFKLRECKEKKEAQGFEKAA